MRVKNSIIDGTLGLDFINMLRTVSYKMNDTINYDIETGLEDSRIVHNRRHEGLISQEVKTALDALGVSTIDTDIVGIDENEHYEGGLMSIRYSALIMPLIKAVQELSQANAQLEARISALEAV